MMPKSIAWTVLFFLTVLFCGRSAFAASMVLFDFDEIHSQSKKGVKASDIEVYMEGLFGADLSVSQNTTAINAYLKVGKGKGPSGITIDFGDNPIDSFSIDFRLFKKAKKFTILADGVAINQQTLSKAQRKAGLAGHQSDFFFDTPVQKLEFIGLKKKSFAIDNLTINIPLPTGEESDDDLSIESETNPPGGEGPLNNPAGGDIITINQVTAPVPEPSSLLMLAVGLGGALLPRRFLVR